MTEIKVKCVVCSTEYDPIEYLDTTSQAYRCASEIHGDLLTGHFGSTVADMEQYRFKPSRPDHIPEGTVCDDCIIKFQSEGLIELDSQLVF